MFNQNFYVSSQDKCRSPLLDNPPAAAPAPSAAANAAAAARRQQQRRDVFGGWRRYGFGRNDPLNWMGDEQPPRRAPREPVRGVGEDPLVIRVQVQGIAIFYITPILIEHRTKFIFDDFGS